MARIRTIKPDFWTDGNMIGVSPWARLFYIGCWNFTLCDHGHLPDDVLGLKLKILPADVVDAEAILAELMDRKRIVRVELPDGRTFLHIPRLEDHQKVDSRWQSRCPVCSHLDSVKLPETPASSGESRSISEPRGDSRLGGEGKGEERKGGEGNPAEPEPPRRCSAHLNDTEPPNCGRCKEARIRWEAWSKSAPPPPLNPNRPKWDPAIHCEHWQLIGTCDACAQEQKHAAEVIYGQFGATG